MARYKLCPVCSHHCKPNLAACPKCRRNISNLPLLDDEVIQVTNEETPINPEPEESGELVRICEICKTKNKSNARKCANADCGEDISDIEPIPITSRRAGTFELVSLDERFRLSITGATHTIGREEEWSEYLAAKPFVSRKHAEITTRGEQAYLTDLGSSNGTFINDKQLEKGAPALLSNNDEIGLGGAKKSGNYQDKAAYFRFIKKQV